jgi:DNA-damage-inducible protein J
MAIMAQEARISSRIDAELKNKADSILAQIGIKPSQAITMFYTQIVQQRGIPFELKIPNEATIEALNEDITNAKRYTNLDTMFADLDADGTE